MWDDRTTTTDPFSMLELLSKVHKFELVLVMVMGPSGVLGAVSSSRENW